MKHTLTLSLLITLLLTASAAAQTRTVHVSPDGTGSGAAEKSPAALEDQTFWRRVQTALARGPVEVKLVPGTYELASFILRDLGHPEHRLTIRGAGDNTILREDPADDAERNNLWSFRAARNVTVSDLRFTGDAESGYALHFADSRNIRVERIRWHDMTGIYYGAFGVTGAKSADITVRDCTFTRIGSGGHAHMIYTAYGPQRLYVLESRFEDCAGDFVHFRDEVDHGVVYACTLRSTGTYRNANPPMVSVPLFNDDDPQNPPDTPNYEYFGTHFLIAGNTFDYAEAGPQGTRLAVLFHHSGFNPPGRTHLLSPQQAEALSTASADARRTLLQKLTGIDLTQVHLFNNTFRNVEHKLAYRALPNYGAAPSGWHGVIDLSDLINDDPVIDSTQGAAEFYGTDDRE